MNTTEKKWLRPTEFHEVYGVPQSTQSQWRHKKMIPYSIIGGYIWYKKEKIDKWIEDNEIKTQLK